MPHEIMTAGNGFTPTEQRITREIQAKLAELAPLFLIQVRVLSKDRVELSGVGFNEGVALELPAGIAKQRLLAELSGILARWIAFNFWEPPEITLFAVPASRIERCAFNWRKQLAQAAKAATKANSPASLEPACG